MADLKANGFSIQTKSYFKRISEYDSETKACILLVLISLINAVACAIGVFAVALWLCFKKNKPKVLNKLNALGFCFVLFSFTVSAVYLNYFGLFGTLYFLSALYIMLRFKQTATFEKIQDIFTVLVSYSVIAFIVALIQKIFDLSAIKGRSASTFLNANYYCVYVSFVIIICLYRILFENRNKALYLTMLFINFVAVFVTASKMPWFGIFAAVGVMLICSKRYKTIAVLGIIAVIGCIALYLLKDYNIAEKLNMNSFAKSFRDRYSYWNQAISGFIEKPLFGRGMLGFLKHSVDENIKALGNFHFDFGNIEASFDSLKGLGWHLHAHNILFDCLYNYGIIGTVILAVLVVKRCIECYRLNGKNFSNPIFTLLISGILVIMVDGIVDCQIVGVQTMFLCVFFMSLAGIKSE